MKRLRTTVTLAAAVSVWAALGTASAIGAEKSDNSNNMISSSAAKMRVSTRAGMSPMYSLSRSSAVNDSAAALDNQNWKKGVELAQKAIESKLLSPDTFPLANNNLCIGLTFLEQAKEALPFCNQAVEGRPRQWEFYNNRAIAHYYLGDYERSLVDYYLAMTFSRSEQVLLENLHLTLKARQQEQPHTAGPNT